jgi:hypothetical protein
MRWRRSSRPVGPSRVQRRWLALGACLIFVSTTVLLLAYTHEQDDVNGPVATQWCNGNFNNGLPCTNTVNWSLGPTGTNVDTVGGPTIPQAIQNAFASWQEASLNGQLLANLVITQGPPSSTTAPDSQDCVNVVGFTDTNTNDFPTGTIAFTDIATVFGSPPPLSYQCAHSSDPTHNYKCPLSSCIVDADIEFNPKDTFATAPTTPQNDFDLQAIATHEAGHLLGMDHSGLANAIMFAFGDTGGVPQRTLSVDDAIGIGSVYPSANFAAVTGTLSGTVTLGGSGLFASHVVVMDATSGAAVTDTLTNKDGSYQVAVPQGQYHVIAVPLKGIYDLSDFGGWACGYNENAQPCCDPSTSTSCTGNLSNSMNTNFSGKFN